MADDSPANAGRYRRWSGVSLHGRLLYSVRPLSVTRLNEAAVDVVETVTGDFHSPAEIARATDRDTASVARLLDRLHQRGFLEWAPARDATHTPSVSVVVTVRNGHEHLRDCLDALAELEYPTYEVVVIDDGSTDNTVSVARSHPLADCGRLEVVSVGTPDEPLGIGASRNHGVAVARSDVIAFSDADCRPRRNWLSELVPCLAAHDLVGGRVRPHGRDPVDEYEGINSSLDMGEYAARIDPDGATPYLPTANLVGRRTVFETVPFPEQNVAEDVDVCWRAFDRGFDVVYTPTGIVEHDYRADLRAFADRRSDYGASEALLSHTYRHGDRVALPVEPLFIVVLLFLSFAAGVPLVGVFALAAVGSVMFLGFAVVRLFRRLRALGEVVSVITILRSYGRGILSTWYAFFRELTRYYSVPLGIASAILAIMWPVLGTVAFGAVLIGVAIPAIVEYTIYRPTLSLSQYAYFYIADHLGYQRGVYRGTIEHGTVAHLTPLARFQLTGPIAPVFGILSAWLTSNADIRTVVVGDYTARFRIATEAEQWWFESDDLRGERLVLADILTRVRADDVFFDIGANIGLYTCFMGQAMSTEIVAFEPHSTNADQLAANAELNSVDVQIELVALGEVEGSGRLVLRADEAGVGEHTLRLPDRTVATTGDDSAGSIPCRSETVMTDGAVESLPESNVSDSTKTRTVPVVSGDSVSDRNDVPSPTVLKIDVEGAEIDVLRGLDRTLSRTTCRLLYCEIHPKALAERGERPADVERFLEERGFVCKLLNRADDRYRLRARRVDHIDMTTADGSGSVSQ